MDIYSLSTLTRSLLLGPASREVFRAFSCGRGWPWPQLMSTHVLPCGRCRPRATGAGLLPRGTRSRQKQIQGGGALLGALVHIPFEQTTIFHCQTR